MAVDIEIRYRSPWYWRTGTVVAIVAQSIIAAIFAVPIWFVFRDSRDADSPIDPQLYKSLIFLGFFTIFYAVMILKQILSRRQILLEIKRGRVCISEVGISITDWRLRVKEIAWSDIDSLRVVTCGGLCRLPVMSIICTDGHVIKLSQWLQLHDQKMIQNTIIDRLGMEIVKDSWFGTTYRRKNTCDRQK